MLCQWRSSDLAAAYSFDIGKQVQPPLTHAGARKCCAAKCEQVIACFFRYSALGTLLRRRSRSSFRLALRKGGSGESHAERFPAPFFGGALPRRCCRSSFRFSLRLGGRGGGWVLERGLKRLLSMQVHRGQGVSGSGSETELSKQPVLLASAARVPLWRLWMQILALAYTHRFGGNAMHCSPLRFFGGTRFRNGFFSRLCVWLVPQQNQLAQALQAAAGRWYVQQSPNEQQRHINSAAGSCPSLLARPRFVPDSLLSLVKPHPAPTLHPLLRLTSSGQPPQSPPAASPSLQR